MPRSDNIDSSITRLELRVISASSVLSSKLQSYQALLLVGSPSQREAARCDVMDATEFLLDIQEAREAARLEKIGIDPQKRHLSLED